MLHNLLNLCHTSGEADTHQGLELYHAVVVDPNKDDLPFDAILSHKSSSRTVTWPFSYALLLLLQSRMPLP